MEVNWEKRVNNGGIDRVALARRPYRSLGFTRSFHTISTPTIAHAIPGSTHRHTYLISTFYTHHSRTSRATKTHTSQTQVITKFKAINLLSSDKILMSNNSSTKSQYPSFLHPSSSKSIGTRHMIPRQNG